MAVVGRMTMPMDFNLPYAGELAEELFSIFLTTQACVGGFTGITW